MSFKLPHQKGSPFHQQKPQSKEEILNYYKAANEKAQLKKEEESNRLSDDDFEYPLSIHTEIMLLMIFSSP